MDKLNSIQISQYRIIRDNDSAKITLSKRFDMEAGVTKFKLYIEDYKKIKELKNKNL